ncbi:polyprenyl synthetase family protein [Corynebacterium tapiri]|uniref:Polyprenyl synthetase family protein n=1 Tax=Corynebacterium tapiri TaxID=1448266 RepID=A0A5C4U4V4_9CORY|nr:polyprenyl synthetase family protein [Corynebacterium tapiri]TNL97269.1 polyprenyl synthetase family protein [Corynebacterium tapiri]
MTHGQNPPQQHAGSVDLGDPELNARVATGMEAVEQRLADELAVGEDFVLEKAAHLVHAGGKRFRPMMTLLASEFGKHPGCEDVIKAATVVELVHVATLYHDDVMDEADRRRGVESANSRWGNSVAILSGDILLSHASALMAQLDVETVAHFADTFRMLVTGQMRETIGPRDGDDVVEHYLKVIEEKTAVLIASAGHLGAIHSGASSEHVDALRTLGSLIGMIFQIVDDVIDIFSTSEESGKTPGTDLREGVLTLPVLLAMEGDGEVAQELRSLLDGPLHSDDDVNHALDLLSRSNGRERTLEVVNDYLARAEEQFDRLPDIPAKAALRSLCHYTVSRVG